MLTTLEVKNFLSMKTNFKHSAIIEQYISNEMPTADRIAFEKELITNSDLAREYLLSQQIDSALMRDDVIDLRRKLITAIESGHKKTEDKPVVALTSRKWWLAAASVIVLCAVAATLYWQMPHKVSNDELFQSYYSTDNVVNLTRGDQNIVEAVFKFQQKDFKSASQLFENILATDKSNIAVWFYYGISNIETMQYQKSITAFQTIINDKNNLYVEHAGWYLGLCYLKSGQKDKAKEQFTAIASDRENYYNSNAQEILKKLQLN